MAAPTEKVSVLFVCLGNICRSPIAEAVLKKLVADRGLEDKLTPVDSCGTGDYHVGQRPDARALATLSGHGVPSDHRARQINAKDFTTFTYIFGMDASNMSNIQRQKPKNSTAIIEKLVKYDPKKQSEITDPYYGGDAGFEEVYQQCVRCCNTFLDSVFGK